MHQTFYQGSPAVEEEVTALALDYKLMSQYTSFVAVDERDSKPTELPAKPPRRMLVPVPLPEGTRWEGFFGPLGEEAEVDGNVDQVKRLSELESRSWFAATPQRDKKQADFAPRGLSLGRAAARPAAGQVQLRAGLGLQPTSASAAAGLGGAISAGGRPGQGRGGRVLKESLARGAMGGGGFGRASGAGDWGAIPLFKQEAARLSAPAAESLAVISTATVLSPEGETMSKAAQEWLANA